MKRKNNAKKKKARSKVKTAAAASAALHPAKEGEVIEGLGRLAERLSDFFKSPVSKQNITHWRKRNPPFPMPSGSGSNRYNWPECKKWYETHIQPHAGPEQQQELAFAKEAYRAELQSKIDKQAREAWEHDRERGWYISKIVATNTIMAALRLYHAFVRVEWETILPAARRDKLLALGCPPEMVAAFHEFDLMSAQAAIGRIEQKCETECRKDQLKDSGVLEDIEEES